MINTPIDHLAAGSSGKNAPSIHVICSSAAKSGVLHGKWIDASQKLSIIQAEIQIMLATSPIFNAQEWEIDEYSNFSDLSIDKHENLFLVHKKALLVVKDRTSTKILNLCLDLKSAQKVIDHYSQGEYANELEFAIAYFDERYIEAIPEEVRSYIDYTAFKTAIFAQSFFSCRFKDKLHVFARRLGT